MDFNEESIEWLMQTSQTVEKLVADSSNEINTSEQNHQTTFLKILDSEFISKSVVKENTAFGVLRTEEGFQSLLRKLKAFGYFFSVRTSRTSKGTKTKIFHRYSEQLVIEHPYSVNKCVRLYCSASKKSSSCPAYMIMREVKIYKDFLLSRSNERQVNQKLKKAIGNGSINWEQQLWVLISLPRAHNHAPNSEQESLNLRRGLDAEVKATMLQMTVDQNLTIEDIKKKLKGRIDKEFAREEYKPSPDNRAFFPSDKVIYNHLRDSGLIKSRIRKSTDLETLRNEVNEKLKKVQEIVKKIDKKTSLKKVLTWLTEIEEFAIK